jgi:hypothetical protein
MTATVKINVRGAARLNARPAAIDEERPKRKNRRQR